MKIKNLILETPFFLAPMEAVNCTSFRLLCKQRGASLVYTDMIDADLFMENIKELGELETIKKLINPIKEEKPLAIQLGGSNIKNLISTLKIVEPFADLIDYNAGCPLGYMLGKKGGCYLMKHPIQLYKIISELRKSTILPLTVKLRSGWDKESINILDIAKELEKLKIDAIAIHPRTRKQGYKNKSDWNLVRQVKKNISIPVILSGDVTNVYQAHMAFLHTKCDAIMIARGAKNNPSIFKYLNKYWISKTNNNLNLNKKNQTSLLTKPNTVYDKKVLDIKKDFFEFLDLYEKYESRNKLSEIKDHGLWLVRELRTSSILKQKILKSSSKKELSLLFSKI